jgi:hypothetical protein
MKRRSQAATTCAAGYEPLFCSYTGLGKYRGVLRRLLPSRSLLASDRAIRGRQESLLVVRNILGIGPAFLSRPLFSACRRGFSPTLPSATEKSRCKKRGS